MVDHSPIASIGCGTLFATISWDDQPLHSDPSLIFELPLADGVLALLVLENRLVVEIGCISRGREQLTDQWITPEIIRSRGSVAIATMQWRDGKITSLRLNAKEVPRHSQAEEFVLEPPEDGAEPISGFAVDQTMEFDFRKIETPESLSLRQLIQTARRLEASLQQLRSNTPENILDIAVHLRTLLCGQATNGGRLLFRCAEEVGIQPVCYTFFGVENHVDSTIFMDGKTVGSFSGVSGVASKQTPVETDLAQWLEQPGLITPNQEKIPHWKLIYDVAGKFGAHADHNTTFLLSFMNPHDVGINLGILVPQFRTYGHVALEASKRVIIQAQS